MKAFAHLTLFAAPPPRQVSRFISGARPSTRCRDASSKWRRMAICSAGVVAARTRTSCGVAQRWLCRSYRKCTAASIRVCCVSAKRPPRARPRTVQTITDTRELLGWRWECVGCLLFSQVGRCRCAAGYYRFHITIDARTLLKCLSADARLRRSTCRGDPCGSGPTCAIGAMTFLDARHPWWRSMWALDHAA